jgi:hypothetical protein
MVVRTSQSISLPEGNALLDVEADEGEVFEDGWGKINIIFD